MSNNVKIKKQGGFMRPLTDTVLALIEERYSDLYPELEIRKQFPSIAEEEAKRIVTTLCATYMSDSHVIHRLEELRKELERSKD